MSETLECGSVCAEFVNIGEGYGGDYSPDDPHDTPLLRLNVSIWREGTEVTAGEWLQYDNGSFCTHLPEDTSREVQQGHLLTVMHSVRDDVLAGRSIRRKMEEWSWIGFKPQGG